MLSDPRASMRGFNSYPTVWRFQNQSPSPFVLMHRTASALLVAEQFCAVAAVMLVHSFSPSDKWFKDFLEFATLFEVRLNPGEVVAVGERRRMPLFLGWCRGEQRFREESVV
jgi:hypothetical protein